MTRPAVPLRLLWLLAPAMVLAGCESGSFLPPPPPELNSPETSPAQQPAKVVELVLGSDDSPDRTTWSQVIRLEAGTARVGFRVSAPGPKEPPEKQAELIRKAAARGASVLIVEPAKGSRVVEALEQVRAGGTPVVLLDRPVDAGSGKPFPVFLLDPGADSARTLVAAAVEDARTAKLPADGKAIVVAPGEPDVHSDELRAGLEEALKKAGVAGVETVAFDRTVEGASTAIAARLAADPRITLVLAANGEALSGAIIAREKVQAKHLVIIAGYTEMSTLTSEASFQATAAVADRNMTKLARGAFQAALRLAAADGKPVPDRTEIPPTIHRYPSRVIEPVPPPSARSPMSAPGGK